MTYRLALPTLTLSALVFAAAAGAQAQQKKPGTGTATTARPASTAPAPTPSVAPAPTPAPVHEPVASAPARPSKPAAPEKAAPTSDHVRFGIAGGMAAPMSSLGQAYTVGYHGGAFLEGRPLGFPVGLRGDIQYASFGVKTGITSPSYTVLQFTGAAVYDFPSGSGGKSPFFATGGIGLYRNKGAGPSQTDFGQNLGLGFNIRKARFKPFVEGRFHFFNNVENFNLAAGFHI
ncbi:MAG: hypothetical protein H7099_00860 [Gemmatimonadaceae bacterium]|nr:hypothetical protein [Gemmatimonadaceae bacterium]